MLPTHIMAGERYLTTANPICREYRPQADPLPGTRPLAQAALQASATVRMRRPGVAVLSASYDPGWTATVNGRRRPVRMVAPALVAVDVPAGTDHVVFRFHGYDDYPALFALSGLTIAIIAIAPVGVRRARWRRASAGVRSGGNAPRPESEQPLDSRRKRRTAA